MSRSFLLKFSFLVIFSLLFSACSLPFFGKKKQAALQVTTAPKATVFLDGEHIGTTPFFDDKLKPGEYTLKLVPDDTESMPWEAKIKLVSGILTVVSRELANSPELSSGYILSLESLADKKDLSLAVVTNPDGAVVSLDSEPKGFSPLLVDKASEGEHLLVVSSPGYVEKSLKAKLVVGYKLTASVQLAKLPEEPEKKEEEEDKALEEEDSEKTTSETKKTVKESSTEEESTSSASTTEEDEIERPYVKIKETPTGWLNVRSEPSTSGKEETIITKIDPGEVFPFIEKNDTGWYKIELEDGEMGWITSRYAELFK